MHNFIEVNGASKFSFATESFLRDFVWESQRNLSCNISKCTDGFVECGTKTQRRIPNIPKTCESCVPFRRRGNPEEGDEITATLFDEHLNTKRFD